MIRLVAGFFSFFALAGIAAIGGVGLVVWLYANDLPSHDSLAAYEPATLSRVYSAEGDLLAEFARERRIFVPIEEIPDHVKNAFIAAEDQNFYSHAGIDITGIARAALANLEAMRRGSSALQGGSTITQQVMKNFLLTSDRSIERKIKEAILSVRIERAMSKDRILELYLNEIFLGQNAYGVAAAAQRYFGKTLEALSVGEAAYLAALPQAPSVLHPIRQRARAEGRRNYVLRQMRDNGFIDALTAEAGQAAPLVTLLDGTLEREVATPAKADYFADEVRRQLTAELGAETLFEGGLTIRATIDHDKQAIAATALRRALESYDRTRSGYRGPVANIADLDPADEASWRAALADVDAARDIPDWRLAVVLLVGERSAQVGIEGFESDEPIYVPFSDVREWARPVDENGRLGPTPRQPADVWSLGDVIYVRPIMAEDGETIERWSMRQIPGVQGAFMAMDIRTGRVLALQGGFSYGASVFNRATQALRQPGSSFKPFVYAAALDQGYTPATVILDAPITVEAGDEIWRPQNASENYYGPAPMRIGLEMSRNLMTIRLAQEIGMESVSDYANRFGVYDAMPPLLSYSLGAGETTLSQMVAAYAMFANGGRRIEPTVVDRVQSRRGANLWRHDAQRCAACAEPALDTLPAPSLTGTRIMDPVTAYQITSMLHGVTIRGTAVRPFSDVAVPVAGKTGTTNEARDVWFVGFTPQIAAGCFIGYDTPTPLGRGAFGGTLCAPVVAEFFREVYRDQPGGTFAEPPGITHVGVDRWSGQPSNGDGAISEVFRAGNGPLDGIVIGAAADTTGFFARPTEVATPDNTATRTQPGATPPVAAVPRASDGFGTGGGGLY